MKERLQERFFRAAYKQSMQALNGRIWKIPRNARADHQIGKTEEPKPIGSDDPQKQYKSWFYIRSGWNECFFV